MVADTKTTRKTFKTKPNRVINTCRKDSPESSCQPPTASPARFILETDKDISLAFRSAQRIARAEANLLGGKIMTFIDVKEPFDCPFHYQHTKKRAWCRANNYGIDAENVDCQKEIPKDCPLRENQIAIQLTSE